MTARFEIGALESRLYWIVTRLLAPQSLPLVTQLSVLPKKKMKKKKEVMN